MGAGLGRLLPRDPVRRGRALHTLRMLGLYYILFKLAQRLHRQHLSTLTKNPVLDPTVFRFSANTLQWVAYWGVASVLLTAAGAGEPAEILQKMFGVGGIAFGFAAQHSISNLISGLMLLLAHPFRIGDHIEAAGVSGWVLEIGLLHTYVNTDNHIRVMLPNSKVINTNIINNSKLVARIVCVPITVSDKEDVRMVRKALKEAATDIDAKVQRRYVKSDPCTYEMDRKMNKMQWRQGGVEGRGRPLSALKPATVKLEKNLPKEQVTAWTVKLWAPSAHVDEVTDMLFEAILAKMAHKKISCSH